MNFFFTKYRKYLPQEFSSEPSAQSFSPLQKRPLSMQVVSPQASWPSCIKVKNEVYNDKHHLIIFHFIQNSKLTAHTGSSVNNSGFTLRSLCLSLQFFTAFFQSQVCLSMSKYKPAGQRMACKPCKKKKKMEWLVLYFFSSF